MVQFSVESAVAGGDKADHRQGGVVLLEAGPRWDVAVQKRQHISSGAPTYWREAKQDGYGLWDGGFKTLTLTILRPRTLAGAGWPAWACTRPISISAGTILVTDRLTQ